MQLSDAHEKLSRGQGIVSSVNQNRSGSFVTGSNTLNLFEKALAPVPEEGLQTSSVWMEGKKLLVLDLPPHFGGIAWGEPTPVSGNETNL